MFIFLDQKIYQILLFQGDNGRLSYQIVHGDRHQQFAIDPDTGIIKVAQSLDREMISSYGKTSLTAKTGFVQKLCGSRLQLSLLHISVYFPACPSFIRHSSVLIILYQYFGKPILEFNQFILNFQLSKEIKINWFNKRHTYLYLLFHYLKIFCLLVKNKAGPMMYFMI